MSTAIREIHNVRFPGSSRQMVNMMPIIFGDGDSIPGNLKRYEEMIGSCNFENGTTVYLTVNESNVEPSTTQRRPGIHIESPLSFGWGGGGGWGGRENNLGLYMASTDGATRVWDCLVEDRDNHGRVNISEGIDSFRMKESCLYWMTDHTPHEALPSSGSRQFFRLVSHKIGGWFSKHNTANPLGVKPDAPIIGYNKFD